MSTNAPEKNSARTLESSGASEIFYFTQDESVNIEVDTMKDVEQNLNEKQNTQENNISMEIDTLAGSQPVYTTKKISGVSYKKVYHGCGPTAGYIIVEFWDRKGYPKLISSSQSAENVIDDLYVKMNTFPVDEKEDLYATWPEDYSIGLEHYLNSEYSNTFSVRNCPADEGLCTYDVIKQEVKVGRPGTILYSGNMEKYGAHYVTFTGYSFCDDEDDYDYIIHDSWTYSDVYRDWNNDVDNIVYMYKIQD